MDRIKIERFEYDDYKNNEYYCSTFFKYDDKERINYFCLNSYSPFHDIESKLLRAVLIYKKVKEELEKIKNKDFNDEVCEEYRGDYELFQRQKKYNYERLEKYNKKAIEKANELIKQFLIEKYGNDLKNNFS